MAKKIGIIISLVLIVVIIGFLYTNVVIKTDEKSEESIQNISQNIQETTETTKDIATETSDTIQETITNHVETIKEIPQSISIKDISNISKKIQESNPVNKKPEINVDKLELRIHELVNVQRVSNGLHALTYDATLSTIAKAHSKDMSENNYFAHDNLSGLSPADRVFQYGYEACGELQTISLQREYDQNVKSSGMLSVGISENISRENLYDSYSTNGIIRTYDWNTREELAQSTVDGWMNNLSEIENILGPYHSEGIGIVISDDIVYITQNLC
jgi:uncharacterized protein YkwD